MPRPRKELTIDPALEQRINKEVGEYLKEKIAERKWFLRSTGAIYDNTLNRSELARHCGVSSPWINGILQGEKTANEEILEKIADFLKLDEEELFRVARKLPPTILQKTRHEFLGDLGMEDISGKEVNQEVGNYLQQKIKEYEEYVKQAEQVKSYSLSYTELGRRCGKSDVWTRNVLMGNTIASDELLVKLADILRIDIDELFRVARRVPPYLLNEAKRKFLGEYYIEGC